MKPEDEVVNLVSGHPGGDPDDPSDDDEDEDGDDDRGGRGRLPHGKEDAGRPQGGVVPLVRDEKYLPKLRRFDFGFQMRNIWNTYLRTKSCLKILETVLQLPTPWFGTSRRAVEEDDR